MFLLKESANVGLAGLVEPSALIGVPLLAGLGDAAVAIVIAKDTALVSGFEHVGLIEGGPGNRAGFIAAYFSDCAVGIVVKGAASGIVDAIGAVDISISADITEA